jgi:hypothetical protein
VSFNSHYCRSTSSDTKMRRNHQLLQEQVLQLQESMELLQLLQLLHNMELLHKLQLFHQLQFQWQNMQLQLQKLAVVVILLLLLLETIHWLEDIKRRNRRRMLYRVCKNYNLSYYLLLLLDKLPFFHRVFPNLLHFCLTLPLPFVMLLLQSLSSFCGCTSFSLVLIFLLHYKVILFITLHPHSCQLLVNCYRQYSDSE